MIFRVVKGMVRVEKGDSKTTVGQGAVVNRLAPGQLFGEMSFLDGTTPCANCIADSDDVELLQLEKATLANSLAENSSLARDFYKHMAISATQKLSIVSAASAEIPEAPRGQQLTQDAGIKNIELSAAKLIKVRKRLQVPDTVGMTAMMKTSMVSGRSKKHGTLYVFETLVGFITKAFGLKTHESFHFGNVSEVLRETFTLKLDDNAIELHLTNGKEVTFYPANVDEAYEAIHRCRAQYQLEFAGSGKAEETAGSGKEGDATDRKKNRRGSNLAAPDLASMNPHAKAPRSARTIRLINYWSRRRSKSTSLAI